MYMFIYTHTHAHVYSLGVRGLKGAVDEFRFMLKELWIMLNKLWIHCG